MKTVRMRWIDHWLGLPLCFCLGLMTTMARGLLPRRRRTITGERTLLVFKFFGLGSIVQISPLLRAIRSRYPSAKLVFLSFETNRSVLERLGACHEIRTLRTRSIFGFAIDTIRQLIWMHRSRVEVVLDLEFFSKYSTLMSFLSGAPVRVGFHLNDFWRYTLVTHPVYFNYYRHIQDVYGEVAERIDVQITEPALSRLDPTTEGRAFAERFLRDAGWTSGSALLGLNANAGDLSLERRWPKERFAELASELLRRHESLWIVLTGSASETEYVEQLARLIPGPVAARVINAAGKWSLDQLLGGLSFMTGFLTNDSGPMHLAASLELRMVSLWGPGRPEFYAPRSPRHRAIYANFACSPCLYMFTAFEGMWCGHEAWCMQAIETRTVLAAVEEMLSTYLDRDSALAAASPPARQNHHGN